MRIVILVPKLHAGAELAVNQLLRRPDLKIVGMVRSDLSPFRKKYWSYIRYGIRRAGIFYGALIGLTAYLPGLGLMVASALIWRRRRQWLTLNQLLKRYPIALHDTQNINGKKAIKVIKSWKPDIIVSLYFDQILKKTVIEIPRVAALNMHPGILPSYRGLWPEFWKLHNREKHAGVTIHHINEGIDSGDVIAQMKFPIRKTDTKFSLVMKSAHRGTNLLIQTLDKFKRGIPLKPLKLKGKSRYYSLPNKTEFLRFYARGKRLFSWLGFWKVYDRHY